MDTDKANAILVIIGVTIDALLDVETLSARIARHNLGDGTLAYASLFVQTLRELSVTASAQDMANVVNRFDQANTNGVLSMIMGGPKIARETEKLRKILNEGQQRTILTAEQAGNLLK